ncbi:ABC transporter ATP-binding protein [Desulfovibrio subterraneus]|uniref:ABC transporter ATP-binding protein n=1 Tax=Desulfovibrio subterraneus TaxID=2718620 RepID=A0A7J0BGX6_9BACT|nr:ABC transporter ATP-binding protein [Desulfovibrio subterraneus]GFM32808.1 ABC transporter ATP-binding protein [Desulfovibrio subterraneus]
MATVLDVRSLSKNFGGLRALNDVDMKIDAGEIVALIGPNGAGKTTFFNCITSIYVPTEGEVRFTPKNGKQTVVKGLKPNLVTELGMARTFQNIRLFKNMTVLENVMIARHCRTRAGIIGALLRTPAVRREEQEIVDKSYDLLKYIGLHKHYNDLACNLPYGEQRRLEIARALATEPSLLLLDEPAAGMNPQETASLKQLVLRIRDELDMAILLIEHDMSMVMSLSERIYVMEYGCMIAHGTPAEISKDPRVIKAYLGEDHA